MLRLLAIDLDEDQLEAVNRPVVGEGGFQSLFRRLQNQLINSGDTHLILTERDFRLIRRYADVNGGSGGFQSRLRTILADVLIP